jgi:hypothetical protein
VGENILWLYLRQRTNNQNFQGAEKKLNSPQINEPIKKWVTKQNFFKGRTPNGQKTHEKMLTISSHKGNANQNHTESTSLLLE